MYRRKVYFFFSSRRRHTRCALVTGVQTCALPIYVVMGGAGSAVAELLNESGVVLPILHLGLPDAFQHHASREDLLAEAGLDDAGIGPALLQRWPVLAKRSAERRVGTECVSTRSSRWAPSPSKTKKHTPEKELETGT